MSELQIRSNGAGHGETVIDGQHMESAVVGLTFESKPKHVDTLTLHLHIIEGASIDSDHATVTLPVTTIRLLMSLGWTPPAGTVEAMNDQTIRYVEQEPTS